MRKFLLGAVLLFAVLPILLSFAAKYYLQHHFVSNFDTNIDVSKLNFEYGWFSSNADYELMMNEYNLLVKTNNQIQQGPIIWKTLTSDPINSFVLYKIDTRFDLFKPPSDLPLSNQPGSATTLVNYLGTSRPSIQHPSLDFSLKQARIFADLAEIDSEITSAGTIVASIKTNQFELGNNVENIYLVKPKLKITINPNQPLLEAFELNAINLSSLLNTNQLAASGVKFSSRLDQNDNSYQLVADFLSEQFSLNRAKITDLNAHFSAKNLDQTLIDFIAVNFDSISLSIQNNQWLVLLKHFSDLLKLINTNQPDLSFLLNGQAEDQRIKLDFSAQLLANDETELNPFSLLENLTMRLETELPEKLINDMEQPAMLAFVQSMLEKGLLIKAHQSYYANLSFENTKLKANH